MELKRLYMDAASSSRFNEDYKIRSRIIMTRRLTGRLSAAVAIAAMAAQAAEAHTKAKPLDLSKRLSDEYDEFPAECQFVNPNRAGKRGGNGKGRKWWDK
jgi:hypothetical protein